MSDQIQEIRQVDRELAEAGMRADASSYEKILADSYVGTGADGRDQDKASMIALVRNIPPGVMQVEQVDVSARIESDTGLVTGVNVMSRMSDGGTTAIGRFKYLHVYVRNDTGWRLVAGQATRIPEEPPQT